MANDPYDVDTPAHKIHAKRRRYTSKDAYNDETITSSNCYCGINCDHEFIQETVPFPSS